MARKSAYDPDRYDSHREEMAEKSRQKSAAGREAGPLPPIENPERREACKADLKLFKTTYFPHRYPLPFADFHRKSAKRMERCIHDGGLSSIALPRGSGKTTDAEVGAIYAIVYGFRKFVVLVGATEKHSTAALKRIQAEVETNELLAADFPDACYLIRALERIHNRARGQTLNGEPTRIEWTAEGITFPRVPGAACSGSIIRVAGLTGALRGLQALNPDGGIVRPDLIIIDDAQTRESAKSPTQTAEREAIISDDILGLAGPTTQIAAFNLCTVIYPNDLSDRFLSPEKHPEWQGIREKLLNKFPTNLDLWDEYRQIKNQSFRDGDEGKAGNEFYLAHREQLDAGAEVTWPDRFKTGEISAIQSAMNLYLANPRGFRAEYQNEPDALDADKAEKQLKPELVFSRKSGYEKGKVPNECNRITAFIDVGGELLWYAIVAWNDSFGGSIIDYGCYPQQARLMFEAADPRPGLSSIYPNYTEPQRVFAGLQTVTNDILGRTFQRDSSEMRVDLCLIDSGWQTKTVYQFIKQSEYSRIIHPSKGVGRSTTSRGVGEWKPRPGERAGWNWKLTAGEFERLKLCQFDADNWKTFTYNALTAPLGGKTGLSLYGTARDSVAIHELLANHVSAEYSMPVTLRGMTFDKWSVGIGTPDNHLFDCLVGSAVAASVTGLQWHAAETPQPEAPPAPRRRLSEIQAEKLGRPVQRSTEEANESIPEPPRRKTLSEIRRENLIARGG